MLKNLKQKIASLLYPLAEREAFVRMEEAMQVATQLRDELNGFYMVLLEKEAEIKRREFELEQQNKAIKRPE